MATGQFGFGLGAVDFEEDEIWCLGRGGRSCRLLGGGGGGVADAGYEGVVWAEQEEGEDARG